MANTPAIVGIDTLENLLIDRAASPASFAPVPASIEADLIASINAQLALATAILSQPASPAPAA